MAIRRFRALAAAAAMALGLMGGSPAAERAIRTEDNTLVEQSLRERDERRKRRQVDRAVKALRRRPHQGKRECERRRRQMARGQLRWQNGAPRTVQHRRAA